MGAIKLGRPTEKPKHFMLRLRIDNDTLNKLDYCVKEENSNRSEVIRQSINNKYDELKRAKNWPLNQNSLLNPPQSTKQSTLR